MRQNDDYIKSLAEAFNKFNNNTTILTEEYKKLQDKFKAINFELEEKNQELKKKSDENFRVSSYLNNILYSMNSGVLAVDLEGKITIFNKAAEEITGYATSQMIGQYYQDIFSKEVDYKLSINYTLLSGQNIINKEKEIYNSQQNKIPIGFSTSYITNQEGNILGAVEIFNDLTDYKKLEKELIKKNTLAALGEMAATVAHEIRNPLGGINGFANLLYRDLEQDEPKKKLVNKIIQGVDSLNKIVKNLLEYTREFKVQFQIIKVIDFIENLKHHIDSEVQNRDLAIELISEIQSDDYEIKGDWDLLKQSFYNILLNSVDAVEQIQSAKIGIRVYHEEPSLEVPGRGDYITKTPNSMAKQLIFEIWDNGEGISPENTEKIFNPFFTTKENGTGLGLAIVRKIIALHSGEINYSPEYQEGSKFIIRLPGLI